MDETEPGFPEDAHIFQSETENSTLQRQLSQVSLDEGPSEQSWADHMNQLSNDKMDTDKNEKGGEKAEDENVSEANAGAENQPENVGEDGPAVEVVSSMSIEEEPEVFPSPDASSDNRSGADEDGDMEFEFRVFGDFTEEDLTPVISSETEQNIFNSFKDSMEILESVISKFFNLFIVTL